MVDVTEFIEKINDLIKDNKKIIVYTANKYVWTKLKVYGVNILMNNSILFRGDGDSFGIWIDNIRKIEEVHHYLGCTYHIVLRDYRIVSIFAI